jgi:RNA polymerase sigma-70 factor (ECF subfamily)
VTRSQTVAPPPLAQAEIALIAGLRAGKEEALAVAYRQHAESLLAMACYLTGSTADAEDIVHDLFVRLPEALGQYEERGRFPTWLRQCAVRMALMRLRAGRRRQEVTLHDSSAQLVDCPTEGVALVRALERLPDDQRAVVVLKVIEGYSHEEIAELLGIRRNASEVRLHRAIKRLRKLLEDE